MTSWWLPEILLALATALGIAVFMDTRMQRETMTPKGAQPRPQQPRPQQGPGPQPRPQAQASQAAQRYDPTLTELEQALRIDTLALTDAAADQPELFYRVAKLLASLRAEQDYIKQQLSEAEATAQISIRTKLAEAGSTQKVTVGEVDAMVKTDPFVAQLSKKLLDLGRSIGTAHALREAYQQRKSSLTDLIELQRQAGAAVDPAVVKRAVNEQRQDFSYKFGREEHAE